MIAPYPTKEWADSLLDLEAEKHLHFIKRLGHDCRAFRQMYGIPLHYELTIFVQSPTELTASIALMKRLIRKTELKETTETMENHVFYNCEGGIKLYISPHHLCEKNALLIELRQKIEATIRKLNQIEKKISEPLYALKAPIEVRNADAEKMVSLKRKKMDLDFNVKVIQQSL